MTTTLSASMTVTVPGGTLTVRHCDGDGPVLLFLHYWGGSARTWEMVQSRLVGRGMVAWDQRGWGAQAGLPGPYGLEALAGDVEAVVAALGLHDVVVVGHSQGGKVAQLLARRRPGWLRGLVLVAPAPPRPASWVTADYSAQLDAAYETPEASAAALDAGTAVPLPASVRDRAIRTSVSARAEVRHEWPLRGITADLGPGTIDVPTTIVSGALDPVEPAEMLREILLPTLVGPTKLIVVPGAGHLLPLEAPDAVAEAIISRAQ